MSFRKLVQGFSQVALCLFFAWERFVHYNDFVQFNAIFRIVLGQGEVESKYDHFFQCFDQIELGNGRVQCYEVKDFRFVCFEVSTRPSKPVHEVS